MSAPLQINSNLGIGGFRRFSAAQQTAGFKDILKYFLELDQMAAALAKRQATSGYDSGLVSKHLQLDIQFLGFENLQDPDAAEVFEIKLLRTAEGLTLRIATGTAMGGTTDPAKGKPIGDVLNGAQGGSAGTVLWDFRASISSGQSEQDRQELMQALIQVASEVLDYLNRLQMLMLIEQRAEAERVREEQEAEKEAAAKAALAREIEQKRVLLDAIAKDWIKRYQTQEDLEKLNQAKSWHRRLQNYIGSAERQLNLPTLDEGQIAGLQRECESLRLEMRAALAASFSTAYSPVS